MATVNSEVGVIGEWVSGIGSLLAGCTNQIVVCLPESAFLALTPLHGLR
jgi:hypothetical protein